MPHIIIRFMSLKSEKELRKSSVIGISWTTIILIMSALTAIAGRLYLGEIEDSSTVFITMVRRIFPALVSGLLLSAILSAAMSTADSQLLAASSAFASDVYKPVIRKKASDSEMLWAGRIVVIVIAVVALMIASDPNSGSIMGLVENAWGVFGAAFGPVILLSLFWKRLTFGGTVAGIAAGAAVDILWLVFLSSTDIYEIVPGFAARSAGRRGGFSSLERPRQGCGRPLRPRCRSEILSSAIYAVSFPCGSSPAFVCLPGNL